MPLARACCGCSVRTASFLIGWLGILWGIFTIFCICESPIRVFIPQDTFIINAENKMNTKARIAMLVLATAAGLLTFTQSIVLLYGLYQKISVFVRLWFFVEGIYMLVNASGSFTLFLILGDWQAIANFLLYLVIMLLLVIVVSSQYQLMTSSDARITPTVSI